EMWPASSRFNNTPSTFPTSKNGSPNSDFFPNGMKHGASPNNRRPRITSILRDILNRFITSQEIPMASSAVSFAKDNQQRFLGELKDLLRIPSVSTAPEHKEDVRRAAIFVADELRRIGMENVEVIPTKGHPLVYADWLHAPGKPTVLCYAHY